MGVQDRALKLYPGVGAKPPTNMGGLGGKAPQLGINSFCDRFSYVFCGFSCILHSCPPGLGHGVQGGSGGLAPEFGRLD